MTGRALGVVAGTRGGLVDATLAAVAIGDGAVIRARGGPLAARVVAIAPGRATLAPLGTIDGVAAGDAVAADPAALLVALGTPLLGRAVDATGAPADGGPPLRARRSAIDRAACAPIERRAVHELLWTGVRAIDGPLAFARGARIGIIGAPGAGKSTLLETIARGTRADAIVVALVGERGREAQRWLGALDARTSIVVATSDRPAAERVRAAEVAFAHAAALRGRGLDVLLVVDSLARVAAARRELALALGEPLGRGGWPASVTATLAALLERAGTTATGSLSVVATVLSDGDLDGDPLAELARSLLDGHLVLSERLARAGRFPAIDLPRSTSRTFGEVAAPAHRRGAAMLRAAVAALEESADLRAAGLDPAGTDPFLARAVAAEAEIAAFLRQDGRPSAPAATLSLLDALADNLDDGRLR